MKNHFNLKKLKQMDIIEFYEFVHDWQYEHKKLRKHYIKNYDNAKILISFVNYVNKTIYMHDQYQNNIRKYPNNLYNELFNRIDKITQFNLSCEGCFQS